MRYALQELRNEAVKHIHTTHPDLPLRIFSEVFGLSIGRVHQLLKREVNSNETSQKGTASRLSPNR